MKEIGTWLIGMPERFTFEQRIFNFAILMGVFMNLFGTVMDVYYGASIIMDIVFEGCWILTYYLTRFSRYFNLAAILSTGVFVFAFIPYNWIFNGGSGSIWPYYTIVLIAIMSIIFSGKLRMAVVFSMLAVELLLICHDAYDAGSFTVVFRSNMSFVDFFIHMGVIMSSTAIIIIGYSKIYMKEKARSEAYARTIEEQYHHQRYYMENLELLNYKLKSERHDFNNHLGVIYGLLEGEETEKAGEYTRQLVKTAEEYWNIVNIPYSMMRAMLNYKLSAARESRIELRLNVSLPDKLKLNEFGLTIILGNLLDNAMEACAAISEDKRYIDLRILYSPDYLVLEVENPVSQKTVLQQGKRRTTKADPGNHGFGLSNIEYLVNKHNGLIKIEPAKGVFKVSIALLVD